MFAITGITGKVGGETARRLLEAEQPVRAVVRNLNNGDSWAGRGCGIAVAEMGDAESLTSAFLGAEGVFVLLPPNFNPTPGFPKVRAMISALKSALLQAKPGRVVALSTIGAQVTAAEPADAARHDGAGTRNAAHANRVSACRMVYGELKP